MKIKIYAFTDRGRALGEKLLRFSEESEFSNKSNIEENFKNSDALIFIGATGIAVRLIAPFIKSKTSDPAVIVIDDLGRYTISLLSGHLGGGNKLTLELSKFLNNQPVVTTASDGRNMEALDVFAKKHNLIIDDLKKMKEVMTDIVNYKRVGYFSEIAIKPFGINFIESEDFMREDLDSWVIISSKNIETFKKQMRLIPKNLNIGIGCKKDTPYEKISVALKGALSEVNCDIRGIKTVATILLKSKEKGLLKLCDDLGLKLTIYEEKEINKIEIEEPSEFVYRTTGVYAVSEPCAKISGGEIILRKYKKDGVTVSIAKEVENE